MDRQRQYRRFAIGRFTYGTPEIRFASSGAQLRIGQFCSIANGVKIFLGGEHRTDWVTTYPFPVMLPEGREFRGHPATKGDVVIGNDVWIGDGATILSGVQIGDGAVIGANATVAKNVPPYAIVSGSPAKVVRLRFAEPTIEALLRLKWWDWPLPKITAELPLLLSDRIDEFLERNHV